MHGLKIALLIAVLTLTDTAAAQRQAQVDVRAAPVDPALAALSTEALINKLREESEQGIGTHATAWASGFLPIDAEPGFEGGVIGSRRPAKSPVMTELVRRGLTALPALLEHVSDARPSGLRVKHDAPIGSMWYSDEYDARSRDPDQQLPGVNTDADPLGDPIEEHTIAVGDLCFVAIGQIVNRRLNAVRYQPTMCMVINSPVKRPALADAVRVDWATLTPVEHEELLRDEALHPADPWARLPALSRLLFYYPAAGREATEQLLAQPLFESRVAFDFLDAVLFPADIERRAELMARFQQEHGDVGRLALVRCLVHAATFPASQMSPKRAREKELADEILGAFFSEFNVAPGQLPQVADFHSHAELVNALTVFDWPGLTDAIADVGTRAMAIPPVTIGGRIERDDLVVACAERLAGGAHDKVLRDFLVAEIEQLRREDEIAVREQPNLPRGNAGYHVALMQRIERYGKFLQRLEQRN